MDQIMILVKTFVSDPATNSFAQGFVGILTVIIAWRFVPMALQNFSQLGGEKVGQRLARGILTVILSIPLGISAAVAIGSLVQRP